MDYAYYLGEEIKYGCYLYYAGWKKLVLHPIQTVQDTAYALYHPVQTGKILFNQVTRHPIGVGINLGLSWTTGHVVSTGMEYMEYLVPEIEASTNLASMLQVQNSTRIAEATISSTVSQALQISTQAMSGGCCGGVCTIGRIGQTTSVITSQSASSTENLDKLAQTENGVVNKKSSSLLSYFWKANPKDKDDKACNNASCATTKNCSEGQDGLRQRNVNKIF